MGVKNFISFLLISVSLPFDYIKDFTFLVYIIMDSSAANLQY